MSDEEAARTVETSRGYKGAKWIDARLRELIRRFPPSEHPEVWAILLRTVRSSLYLIENDAGLVRVTKVARRKDQGEPTETIEELATNLELEVSHTAESLLRSAETLVRSLQRDVIDRIEAGELDRVSKLFGSSSEIQKVCTGCAVLRAELEALRRVAAVDADQEEKP